MPRLLPFIVLLLFLGQEARSQTAIELARNKLETCLFCHRASVGMGSPPVLDGQQRSYLVAQMELFKTGKRQDSKEWFLPPGITLDKSLANPMVAQVSQLSDDVILELAKLFAERPSSASPERLDSQRIARGQTVSEARGCQACHGIAYNGQELNPRLAGQNPLYTEKHLKGMRAKKRDHPQDGGVATLTDQDVLDLSHFFASRK